MEIYTEWSGGHGAGLPEKACYTKLAQYEDLKKQGKMLILPCAVRDTVYWVNNWFLGRASGLTNDEWHITESRVARFFYEEELWIRLNNGENICASEFNETVFLTREEAAAALELRKGERQDCADREQECLDGRDDRA